MLTLKRQICEACVSVGQQVFEASALQHRKKLTAIDDPHVESKLRDQNPVWTGRAAPVRSPRTESGWVGAPGLKKTEAIIGVGVVFALHLPFDT